MTEPHAPTGAERVTTAATYELSVTTLRRRCVIRLAGSVDWQDMPTLRARLFDAVRAPRKPTLLDLSGLDFADSSLLHLLLDLQRHFRAGETELKLRAELRPVPSRLFAITGAHSYFDLTTTTQPQT
ncbi:STAS domain-containing protein [Streptomyces sp. NPDC007084]|uniref:STAS domain-containing protein n=1 Tax=Streptomyces sp. NPDC007084 TaxID=3154313 RepID=UPI0034528664